MDTYRIFVWELPDDAGEGDWTVVATGLAKWQIRTKLRELYAWGWTQISMRVEAETHSRPAKRWDRDFSPSTDLPKSVKRRLAASFQPQEA